MAGIMERVLTDLEELLESMAELRQEMSQYSSKLCQEWMISRWLRKIEEEYTKTTKEGDDEAKPLDRGKKCSQDPSDTNSIVIMRKPTMHKFEEGSKLSSVGGNKNSDSSQPAQCEQRENQHNSSGVDSGTNQLMKKTEELKISNRPVRRYTMFMTGKCEEEVKDAGEKEQLSLMERQWIEWMDKQEMKGNQVKTAEQLQTKQEGGAGPSVSQPKDEQKQNKRGREKLKKAKMYLSGFFSPYAWPKWERLEEDD